MKKIIATFSLLLIFMMVHAATPVDEQIQQANKLYADGDYVQAAEIYSTLLETYQSADLYYNYGNACYKTCNLSMAILSFERALRLNPRHADAKANLEFVNQQITDRIEPVDTFFVAAFFRNLGRSLAADAWGVMSAVLFSLMLIALFVYIFGKILTLRKIAFGLSVFCFVFTIVSGIYAFSQKHFVEDRVEAIVTVGSVSVKSSPDDSGTEIFVLHEGTKVECQDAVGSWSKIRIADGQIGWLPITTIQHI